MTLSYTKYGMVLLAAGCVALGACKKDTATLSDSTTTTTTAPVDTSAKRVDTSMTTTPPAPALTDANIMARLGMADSMEIAEGKLVASKAKSADVKAYGKMMVDDHTKSKTEGAALAQKAGITPMVMAGDTAGNSMMAEMQMLNSMPAGASFDSTYIAGAIADHQMLLSAITSMQGMAKNDSLKAFMGRVIPVVQKHLDKARDIQSKMMGAKATAGMPAGSKDTMGKR